MNGCCSLGSLEDRFVYFFSFSTFVNLCSSCALLLLGFFFQHGHPGQKSDQTMAVCNLPRRRNQLVRSCDCVFIEIRLWLVKKQSNPNYDFHGRISWTRNSMAFLLISRTFAGRNCPSQPFLRQKLANNMHET